MTTQLLYKLSLYTGQQPQQPKAKTSEQVHSLTQQHSYNGQLPVRSLQLSGM
jgi:hypothetical protein